MLAMRVEGRGITSIRFGHVFQTFDEVRRVIGLIMLFPLILRGVIAIVIIGLSFINRVFFSDVCSIIGFILYNIVVDSFFKRGRVVIGLFFHNNHVDFHAALSLLMTLFPCGVPDVVTKLGQTDNHMIMSQWVNN